jgi:hypothetical protein
MYLQRRQPKWSATWKGGLYKGNGGGDGPANKTRKRSVSLPDGRVRLGAIAMLRARTDFYREE